MYRRLTKWMVGLVALAVVAVASNADAGWRHRHGSWGGSWGGSSGGSWGGSSGGWGSSGSWGGSSGGWGSYGGGGWGHHRRHHVGFAYGSWGSHGSWGGGSSGGYAGYGSSGGWGSSGGYSSGYGGVYGGGVYGSGVIVNGGAYVAPGTVIQGGAVDAARPSTTTPPPPPGAGDTTPLNGDRPSIDRDAPGVDRGANRLNNAVLISVRVPSEAKIFVNGSSTTSTGESRQYISRGLTNGRQYTYELRAELSRDGQTLTDTQLVQVAAGEQAQIAFNFDGRSEPKAATTNRTKLTLNVPADARVFLAGQETKSTGDRREFVSNKVSTDQGWENYEVRVVATVNGREIERNETVRLAAGDEKELTFDFDGPAIAQTAAR